MCRIGQRSRGRTSGGIETTVERVREDGCRALGARRGVMPGPQSSGGPAEQGTCRAPVRASTVRTTASTSTTTSGIEEGGRLSWGRDIAAGRSDGRSPGHRERRSALRSGRPVHGQRPSRDGQVEGADAGPAHRGAGRWAQPRADGGRPGSRTATWTPSAVVTRSSVRLTGRTARTSSEARAALPGVYPSGLASSVAHATERTYRALSPARAARWRHGGAHPAVLERSGADPDAAGGAAPAARCCGPAFPVDGVLPGAGSRWVRWWSSGESRPRAGPGSPSAPSPRPTERCSCAWVDGPRTLYAGAASAGVRHGAASSCGSRSRGSWRGRAPAAPQRHLHRGGLDLTRTDVRLSPPESRRLVEASRAVVPCSSRPPRRRLTERSGSMSAPPAHARCASRWCAAARAPRRARSRCRGSCSPRVARPTPAPAATGWTRHPCRCRPVRPSAGLAPARSATGSSASRGSGRGGPAAALVRSGPGSRVMSQRIAYPPAAIPGAAPGAGGPGSPVSRWPWCTRRRGRCAWSSPPGRRSATASARG